MSEVSTMPADMRAMTDTGLLKAYRADEHQQAAVLSEAARRDRADHAARLRAAVRAEWYDAMFAQYLAAEAECRGNLLSREGLREGIADPISLWTGPRDRAMRLASEELRDYWLVHPRMTITEYLRQRSRAGRIARAEHREARFCIDTEGTITDGQDGNGPRLARDDTRPLRRLAAPEGAPQDASGGTVRRGGRGTDPHACQQAADRTGRPGGAFRVTAPAVNGRRLVAVALDGRRLTLAWVAED
jgi:hypothetical protein